MNLSLVPAVLFLAIVYFSGSNKQVEPPKEVNETNKLTFRKDSVTIDDMTVTLLPNPIGNVEATFSASGSCSILGIGVPIPTESSSNAMIGTGIEIAISSVVNMFDGWLNTQSFTIPL